MNELIAQVSQKCGISEEQASVAVETVLGFIKDKLPAPVAQQVEGVLHGSDLSQGLTGVTKGLGGLFGGQ